MKSFHPSFELRQLELLQHQGHVGFNDEARAYLKDMAERGYREVTLCPSPVEPQRGVQRCPGHEVESVEVGS